jgi:ribosomal protein S6--L-glutamate ligase
MEPIRNVIALEGRLKGCRNVTTLGVRTNFSDYTASEQELIRGARKIYYPTTFYAELFDAVGKQTFPSYHTYKCVQDKIKQSALFDLLNIPHPRTRVFYGNRQKKTIRDYFAYPFIAKIPRGSAMGRGVYLIKSDADLRRYLAGKHPAYIQEYIPLDRDIRVVIIGRRFVHAYWRWGDASVTTRFPPRPAPWPSRLLKTAVGMTWESTSVSATAALWFSRPT